MIKLMGTKEHFCIGGCFVAIKLSLQIPNQHLLNVYLPWLDLSPVEPLPSFAPRLHYLKAHDHPADQTHEDENELPVGSPFFWELRMQL